MSPAQPFNTMTGRLRSEDSWVDIASQPSSSSLSSAGGENHIVTTGLQVRQHEIRPRQPQRRGLRRDIIRGTSVPDRPTSAAGSSQDEYEESESESDRVLSSSNEDIALRGDNNTAPAPSQSDDDDNLTALGARNRTSDHRVFTPQPNAFSHPPYSYSGRNEVRSGSAPQSYFPPTAPSNAQPVALTSTQTNPRSTSLHRRRTSMSQASRSQGSRNPPVPSHYFQTDHDAALRASLSTLLSCAAAVRTTPKQLDAALRDDAPSYGEPTSLRLISESQLFGPERNLSPVLPARRPRTNSSSSAKSVKRKARESSKDRHAKKSRASKATVATGTSIDDGTVSPVLVGWMISAGVVLVFSAISFSVGYAWGKEVGRFEGGSVPVGGCGREAVMRTGSGGGLRRGLRWGSASSSIRA